MVLLVNIVYSLLFYMIYNASNSSAGNPKNGPCPKPVCREVANPFDINTNDAVNGLQNSNNNQTRSGDMFHDISGKPGIKKVTEIHDNGFYTSLCWIEITTITEINDGTKSAIREYAITFETPADIPDKYISKKSDSIDGETIQYKIFDRDTKKSEVVNFTTVSKSDVTIVRQNRKVLCGSGPIYTKEFMEWPHSDRKRVEIRVSPKRQNLVASDCKILNAKFENVSTSTRRDFDDKINHPVTGDDSKEKELYVTPESFAILTPKDNGPQAPNFHRNKLTNPKNLAKSTETESSSIHTNKVEDGYSTSERPAETIVKEITTESISFSSNNIRGKKTTNPHVENTESTTQSISLSPGKNKTSSRKSTKNHHQKHQRSKKLYTLFSSLTSKRPKLLNKENSVFNDSHTTPENEEKVSNFVSQGSTIKESESQNVESSTVTKDIARENISPTVATTFRPNVTENNTSLGINNMDSPSTHIIDHTEHYLNLNSTRLTPKIENEVFLEKNSTQVVDENDTDNIPNITKFTLEPTRTRALFDGFSAETPSRIGSTIGTNKRLENFTELVRNNGSTLNPHVTSDDSDIARDTTFSNKYNTVTEKLTIKKEYNPQTSETSPVVTESILVPMNAEDTRTPASNPAKEENTGTPQIYEDKGMVATSDKTTLSVTTLNKSPSTESNTDDWEVSFWDINSFVTHEPTEDEFSSLSKNEKPLTTEKAFTPDHKTTKVTPTKLQTKPNTLSTNIIFNTLATKSLRSGIHVHLNGTASHGKPKLMYLKSTTTEKIPTIGTGATKNGSTISDYEEKIKLQSSKSIYLKRSTTEKTQPISTVGEYEGKIKSDSPNTIFKENNGQSESTSIYLQNNTTERINTPDIKTEKSHSPKAISLSEPNIIYLKSSTTERIQPVNTLPINIGGTSSQYEENIRTEPPTTSMFFFTSNPIESGTFLPSSKDKDVLRSVTTSESNTDKNLEGADLTTTEIRDIFYSRADNLFIFDHSESSPETITNDDIDQYTKTTETSGLKDLTDHTNYIAKDVENFNPLLSQTITSQKPLVNSIDDKVTSPGLKDQYISTKLLQTTPTLSHLQNNIAYPENLPDQEKSTIEDVQVSQSDHTITELPNRDYTKLPESTNFGSFYDPFYGQTLDDIDSENLINEPKTTTVTSISTDSKLFSETSKGLDKSFTSETSFKLPLHTITKKPFNLTTSAIYSSLYNSISTTKYIKLEQDTQSPNTQATADISTPENSENVYAVTAENEIQSTETDTEQPKHNVPEKVIHSTDTYYTKEVTIPNSSPNQLESTTNLNENVLTEKEIKSTETDREQPKHTVPEKVIHSTDRYYTKEVIIPHSSPNSLESTTKIDENALTEKQDLEIPINTISEISSDAITDYSITTEGTTDYPKSIGELIQFKPEGNGDSVNLYLTSSEIPSTTEYIPLSPYTNLPSIIPNVAYQFKLSTTSFKYHTETDIYDNRNTLLTTPEGTTAYSSVSPVIYFDRTASTQQLSSEKLMDTHQNFSKYTPFDNGDYSTEKSATMENTSINIINVLHSSTEGIKSQQKIYSSTPNISSAGLFTSPETVTDRTQLPQTLSKNSPNQYSDTSSTETFTFPDSTTERIQLESKTKFRPLPIDSANSSTIVKLTSPGSLLINSLQTTGQPLNDHKNYSVSTETPTPAEVVSDKFTEYNLTDSTFTTPHSHAADSFTKGTKAKSPPLSIESINSSTIAKLTSPGGLLTNSLQTTGQPLNDHKNYSVSTETPTPAEVVSDKFTEYNLTDSTFVTPHSHSTDSFTKRTKAKSRPISTDSINSSTIVRLTSPGSLLINSLQTTSQPLNDHKNYSVSTETPASAEVVSDKFTEYNLTDSTFTTPHSHAADSFTKRTKAKSPPLSIESINSSTIAKLTSPGGLLTNSLQTTSQPLNDHKNYSVSAQTPTSAEASSDKFTEYNLTESTFATPHGHSIDSFTKGTKAKSPPLSIESINSSTTVKLTSPGSLLINSLQTTSQPLNDNKNYSVSTQTPTSSEASSDKFTEYNLTESTFATPHGHAADSFTKGTKAKSPPLSIESINSSTTVKLTSPGSLLVNSLQTTSQPLNYHKNYSVSTETPTSAEVVSDKFTEYNLTDSTFTTPHSHAADSFTKGTKAKSPPLSIESINSSTIAKLTSAGGLLINSLQTTSQPLNDHKNYSVSTQTPTSSEASSDKFTEYNLTESTFATPHGHSTDSFTKGTKAKSPPLSIESIDSSTTVKLTSPGSLLINSLQTTSPPLNDHKNYSVSTETPTSAEAISDRFTEYNLAESTFATPHSHSTDSFTKGTPAKSRPLSIDSINSSTIAKLTSAGGLLTNSLQTTSQPLNDHKNYSVSTQTPTSSEASSDKFTEYNLTESTFAIPHGHSTDSFTKGTKAKSPPLSIESIDSSTTVKLTSPGSLLINSLQTTSQPLNDHKNYSVSTQNPTSAEALSDKFTEYNLTESTFVTPHSHSTDSFTKGLVSSKEILETFRTTTENIKKEFESYLKTSTGDPRNSMEILTSLRTSSFQPENSTKLKFKETYTPSGLSITSTTLNYPQTTVSKTFPLSSVVPLTNSTKAENYRRTTTESSADALDHMLKSLNKSSCKNTKQKILVRVKILMEHILENNESGTIRKHVVPIVGIEKNTEFDIHPKTRTPTVSGKKLNKDWNIFLDDLSKNFFDINYQTVRNYTDLKPKALNLSVPGYEYNGGLVNPRDSIQRMQRIRNAMDRCKKKRARIPQRGRKPISQQIKEDGVSFRIQSTIANASKEINMKLTTETQEIPTSGFYRFLLGSTSVNDKLRSDNKPLKVAISTKLMLPEKKHLNMNVVEALKDWRTSLNVAYMTPNPENNHAGYKQFSLSDIFPISSRTLKNQHIPTSTYYTAPQILPIGFRLYDKPPIKDYDGLFRIQKYSKTAITPTTSLYRNNDVDFETDTVTTNQDQQNLKRIQKKHINATDIKKNNINSIHGKLLNSESKFVNNLSSQSSQNIIADNVPDNQENENDKLNPTTENNTKEYLKSFNVKSILDGIMNKLNTVLDRLSNR